MNELKTLAEISAEFKAAIRKQKVILWLGAFPFLFTPIPYILINGSNAFDKLIANNGVYLLIFALILIFVLVKILAKLFPKCHKCGRPLVQWICGAPPLDLVIASKKCLRCCEQIITQSDNDEIIKLKTLEQFSNEIAPLKKKLRIHVPSMVFFWALGVVPLFIINWTKTNCKILAIIPVALFALYFIILFISCKLVSLERESFSKCPHCGKSTNDLNMPVVIASKNCVHCGKQMLETVIEEDEPLPNKMESAKKLNEILASCRERYLKYIATLAILLIGGFFACFTFGNYLKGNYPEYEWIAFVLFGGVLVATVVSGIMIILKTEKTIPKCFKCDKKNYSVHLNTIILTKNCVHCGRQILE